MVTSSTSKTEQSGDSHLSWESPHWGQCGSALLFSPLLTRALLCLRVPYIWPRQALFSLEHSTSRVSKVSLLVHSPPNLGSCPGLASWPRWGKREWEPEVVSAVPYWGGGVCPQPARPSVLCPQSSAHGHQLTRFLWKTGILGAVSQNVWWEEGRSRELLRWAVRKKFHRSAFLGYLSIFFPPQISPFFLCHLQTLFPGPSLDFTLLKGC